MVAFLNLKNGLMEKFQHCSLFIVHNGISMTFFVQIQKESKTCFDQR